MSHKGNLRVPPGWEQRLFKQIVQSSREDTQVINLPPLPRFLLVRLQGIKVKRHHKEGRSVCFSPLSYSPVLLLA